MNSLDPYCGSAPAAGELWARWNLDPILIAVLLGAGALYCHGLRRAVAERRSTSSKVWFTGGLAALAIGLISPLCALSVALFSARASQHMWLALIAAPLLAMSRLDLLFTMAPIHAAWSRVTAAAVAAGLFALALWAWHVPYLYQLTFQSDLGYWAMHVSVLGTAILLWHAVLHGEREQLGGRLFAGFFTLVQMGALGALITLSPRVLYPVHLTTTQSWSLSPLQDQQLGGLIMWVPGCTAVVLMMLLMLSEFLRRDVQQSRLDHPPEPI